MLSTQCEYTGIAEPFSASSAFSAFLVRTSRAGSKASTVKCGPGATRTMTCTRGGKNQKMIIFAKAADSIGLTPNFADIDDHLRISL
jgi:hypothetical protein